MTRKQQSQTDNRERKTKTHHHAQAFGTDSLTPYLRGRFHDDSMTFNDDVSDITRREIVAEEVMQAAAAYSSTYRI